MIWKIAITIIMIIIFITRSIALITKKTCVIVREKIAF